jgi:hypothetical protein
MVSAPTGLCGSRDMISGPFTPRKLYTYHENSGNPFVQKSYIGLEGGLEQVLKISRKLKSNAKQD